MDKIVGQQQYPVSDAPSKKAIKHNGLQQIQKRKQTLPNKCGMIFV